MEGLGEFVKGLDEFLVCGRLVLGWVIDPAGVVVKARVWG